MNKDDLLKMEKLVAECEYFVKKYKPLVKYAEKKSYIHAVLKDDVDEWLKTAKPGDEYIMPNLKIGKRVAENILEEAGLRLVNIVKRNKIYLKWILPITEEPLPF